MRRTPEDQSTDNPREITPYRQSTQGTPDCRLSAMQGQQPEEGGGSRWEGLRKTVGGYVYGDNDQSGSRRQRLAGYVKAANELRQSYSGSAPENSDNSATRGGPAPSSIGSRINRWNTAYEESAFQQPSNQDLMEYVSNGKEEIVLFPSYGRKRIKGQLIDNSLEGTLDPQAPMDAGVKEEDIVADVDIRGWIYTPHTAFPPTRKSRVVMAAMTKLCGLPAIPGDNPAQDALTEQEANQMLDNNNPTSSSSSQSYLGSAASKLSWIGSKLTSQTSQTPSGPPMSREEIEKLHKAMQARLSPFLTTPSFHMPLTIFLYDQKHAQSTTLRTDNLGHFAIRKPLPFFPTHVRVLAGESLCAEEKIRYIDAESGISLISDIDDTIKVSGIGTGYREMFRNVFTREMSTMPVPGVAGWFNSLAAKPYNVQVHYLSNSPWQLFPFLHELLIGYMKLPRGTWHLKKYSGFIQGIFEPVTERKRESLDGLMRDFPGRKWILVGDGGEGDLEVYTEVVKKWPGKVIAVFIRDVTGMGEKIVGGGHHTGPSSPASYFTGNMEAPPPTPPKERRLPDLPNSPRSPQGLSQSKSMDMPRKAPPPPPKPRELRSSSLSRTVTAAQNEEDNLIDLGGPVKKSSTYTSTSSTPDSSRHNGNAYGPQSPQRERHPPPPPPSRRTNTASSIQSIAQSAYNGYMGHDNSSSTSLHSISSGQEPKAIDKRVELWRKRWETANEILGEQGVLLRSWKEGQDAQEECLELVKNVIRIQQQGR